MNFINPINHCTQFLLTLPRGKSPLQKAAFASVWVLGGAFGSVCAALFIRGMHRFTCKKGVQSEAFLKVAHYFGLENHVIKTAVDACLAQPVDSVLFNKAVDICLAQSVVPFISPLFRKAADVCLEQPVDSDLFKKFIKSIYNCPPIQYQVTDKCLREVDGLESLRKVVGILKNAHANLWGFKRRFFTLEVSMIIKADKKHIFDLKRAGVQKAEHWIDGKDVWICVDVWGVDTSGTSIETSKAFYLLTLENNVTEVKIHSEAGGYGIICTTE